MTHSSRTRRAFFEQIGVAGVAGALSSLETARGYAANDSLSVACIGTGGRCQHLMTSLVKVPGVRIAAVCDVCDVQLANGKKLADPKAIASKQYRALLDRKDIDAVLIASPDHWHVPMAVDACNAGKDVYVEKPLTHDPARATPIIDAQNRNKKIVQVGTQQRSMPHIQKARELIEGRADRRGVQGPPDLEPRRHRPIPARPRRRRPQPGRLERLSRQRARPAVRRIPVPQLALVLGFRRRHLHRLDGPLDRRRPLAARPRPSAQGHCGRQSLRQRRFWQTPDTIQCILEYPNNLQTHFEGTFSNATNGAMIKFMGTDGTLYIDRGRYELNPETGKGKSRGADPGNATRARGRLLRQARRRTAAPDQLGRVHPQPPEAERSGGSRRQRRRGRPPGQPGVP